MLEPQKDRVGEQLERGADAVITSVNRLGKWLKGVADVAKGELKATGKELREDATMAGETIRRDFLPAAERKFNQVVDAGSAHLGLAKRRIMAEALAATKDPEKLKQEIEQEFQLAKAAVNQFVSMRRNVANFIKSYHADMSDFDNTAVPTRGLAVYPQEKDLSILRHEFIPVRLYIGEKGLRASEYEAVPESFGQADKARYKFVKDRPATAQDLFELRVTAVDVNTAIREAQTTERYRKFLAS